MWTRMTDIDRMFGAMDLFRNRLDRVFSEYDRGGHVPSFWRASESGPKTNLYDTGEAFEVRVEVPGIAKEDLAIKIQGNYLELSGSRKLAVPEGYAVHRRERGESTFTRSFTLPAEVDGDKVDAQLKDGVLVLTLPKAEAAKPRQITIQ